MAANSHTDASAINSDHNAPEALLTRHTPCDGPSRLHGGSTSSPAPPLPPFPIKDGHPPTDVVEEGHPATPHPTCPFQQPGPCPICSELDDYDHFMDTMAPDCERDDDLRTDVPGGDVVRSMCTMGNLLPMYLNDRDIDFGDNPVRDLDALHSRHFVRRSLRLAQKATSTPPAPSTPTPLLSSASSRTRRSVDVSAMASCSTRTPSTNVNPRSKTKANDTCTTSINTKPPAKTKAKGKKRVRIDPELLPDQPPTKRWLNDSGNLITPDVSWREATIQDVPPSLPNSPLPLRSVLPPQPSPLPLHPSLPSRPAPVVIRAQPRSTLLPLHPSLPSRPAPTSPAPPHSAPLPLHPSIPSRPGPAGPAPPTPVPKPNLTNTKRRHGHRGHVPDWKKAERTMSKGDVLAAGAAPPLEARKLINQLYKKEPGARALHPYLRHFYPCTYKLLENIQDERATFFVDSEGTIFMFRSTRVDFLVNAIDEIEQAHDILVGNDLVDPNYAAFYKDGQRGDHMPIIIGHQRQSCAKPRLTVWHEQHPDRVEKFMELLIVKRIIGLVTRLVTDIFPGVAARFLADAKWHKKRYRIEPMFGLFWNLCLNAWFPGQGRIHCDPHADKKNQIGVCVLLIYVLRCGKNFDHSKYTWLVIWEAGVAIELPPWTLAIYPSALFYHFNIDVDEIEFVTTEGHVRPTQQNSHPLVDGANCGRGSFVFFNQSTMRTGPGTGFDTLKKAKAAGYSGIADYRLAVQGAFERQLVLRPISPVV
ncbi:hypothetical protein B0H14DRAFT_3864268 [Mycena olivaceomarginata]|nr:hypothetical protein B0H14DRAFT_3864268 [Mycena olivaceomarginata]